MSWFCVFFLREIVFFSKLWNFCKIKRKQLFNLKFTLYKIFYFWQNFICIVSYVFFSVPTFEDRGKKRTFILRIIPKYLFQSKLTTSKLRARQLILSSRCTRSTACWLHDRLTTIVSFCGKIFPSALYRTHDYYQLNWVKVNWSF